MKSKFLGYSIMIALAISSYAGATWVQFGTGETTETTVLESNDSHTVVEFTVPGMEVRDTIVAGITYQIVTVPTAGIPGEIGKPQTPVISKGYWCQFIVTPYMKGYWCQFIVTPYMAGD